jgi:hypothetical protein
MKAVFRMLFSAALVFTMTFLFALKAEPQAATKGLNGHKELSQQTKDKLNQLIKLRMKVDQLGAKPQFLHGLRQGSGVRRAATASFNSGNGSSDGIISIPHFDFTAMSGGQAYPLMFVGSQPVSGGQTTAVKNVIIPITVTVPVLDTNLNFTGAEVTLDGSSKVDNTLHSPIYRRAEFAVDSHAGRTQWGDAMQRVTFYKSLLPHANSWHVLLAHPVIAPTVNTADFFDGFAIDFGDGSPLFAFMAGEFIDGIIASYLATNPLPPDVLPIFVTYNNLLFYGGDPFGGCCVLGYHAAVVTGSRGNDLVVQTFMFADWNDGGIFTNDNVQDIHALSHEVSEWLNDPFINNVVPPYANGEGTGCDVIMETGDQLVGNSVPVTLHGYTYHPQTQDILQYFTRETPSSALGGLYRFPDDPNVPNTPAPICP